MFEQKHDFNIGDDFFCGFKFSEKDKVECPYCKEIIEAGVLVVVAHLDKCTKQQITMTDKEKIELLKDALWSMVKAQGRFLTDRYSEGDGQVKNELWRNLHDTGDKARELLLSPAFND